MQNFSFGKMQLSGSNSGMMRRSRQKFDIEKNLSDDPSDADENEVEDYPVMLQDEFESLYEGDEESRSGRLDAYLEKCKTNMEKSMPVIKYIVYSVLLCAYGVYFFFAVKCKFGDEPSIRLTVITVVVAVALVTHCLAKLFGDGPSKAFAPAKEKIQEFMEEHRIEIEIIGIISFFAFFAILIVFVAKDQPANLVSLMGIAAVLALTLVTSAYPNYVSWRPVIGGLTLQLVFAALMLRTEIGFQAFNYIGNRFDEFVKHAHAGAKFLFGKEFAQHYFAFVVLPMIVFFSSVVSVLFHIGALQAVIRQVGLVMQLAMGTTAAESMVAAANIFIGQIEAPLVIRPFIGRLTNSELVSVTSCGFATIAGSVLAAFIGMGLPARHLLSASVMVAPGALALAKISYPETKKSLTDCDGIQKMKVFRQKNLIDAIGSGAMTALSLVGAIAVNLISFLSILSLVDSILAWFSDRLCFNTRLTFELLSGYALWPMAFVIGVGPNDRQTVAELIGLKIFTNEFVAFERLNEYQANMAKYNGTASPPANVTILHSDRSLSIAIYALCGFGNISSISMQLGALSILMPKRKSHLTRLVFRGLYVGIMANLLSASIAGVFYQPPH